MDLQVEDVMIRKAVTIDSGESVQSATEVMQKNSSSSVIVLNEGKIGGILTTRDIVSRVVAKGLNPGEVPVGDVMSSPVIMMRPDTPLSDALKIMIQRKIKKVPLIDGEPEEAKLIGLISFSDVVEYHTDVFNRLWEQLLLTVPAIELQGEFMIS